MPEIGTLGLMSGDGKRSAGHRPQATAPILDSTKAAVSIIARVGPEVGVVLPMAAHRSRPSALEGKPSVSRVYLSAAHRPNKFEEIIVFSRLTAVSSRDHGED